MEHYVTVGVPLYRRLHYLPNVLQAVQRQDYPRIQLIVSDNGRLGKDVEALVKQHYTREPVIVRHNRDTVGISAHYNQLIECAGGDYFVLLADDDEISPNFVSELVAGLREHAEAQVAIGRQEIVDEDGNVLRTSGGPLPAVLDGLEFMRAAWKDYRFHYECFATTLARTHALRHNGGYPLFYRGTHNDDAVLVKLALQGPVVLNNDCTFRWRVYPESHGWSLPLRALAKDSVQFLRFLHKDPCVRRLAAARAIEWQSVRECLEEMTWLTYMDRWATIYQRKLGRWRWAFAPLWMPLRWRLQKRMFRTLYDAFRSSADATA